MLCYSIVDLLAEKLRALAERCRPRDLYDVVLMHRHPDLLDQADAVLAALKRKCAHADIEPPTAEGLRDSSFRGEIEHEWENMLGHQLPHLPAFADYWQTLDDVFAWLDGRRTIAALPRAENAEADPSREPVRAIGTWRRGAPLGLVGFAAANRLKVEIDYRAMRGRQGPRIVEPYSLRWSQQGDLLLFVVNDHGWLRSYRVDHIAGVRATDEPFIPRYLVEL